MTLRAGAATRVRTVRAAAAGGFTVDFGTLARAGPLQRLGRRHRGRREGRPRLLQAPGDGLPGDDERAVPLENARGRPEAAPRSAGSRRRLRRHGERLHHLRRAGRDVRGHARDGLVRARLLARGVVRDRRAPAGRRRARVDGVLACRSPERARCSSRSCRRGSRRPSCCPSPDRREPALPRPGPSPGKVRFGPYEYVISSLSGPVPKRRARQLDPDLEAVRRRVAEVLHRRPSRRRSTLNRAAGQTWRRGSAPPRAGLRSDQNGASTLFGRAAFGNVCGAKTMSAACRRRSRRSRSTRRRSACTARRRSRTSAR